MVRAKSSKPHEQGLLKQLESLGLPVYKSIGTVYYAWDRHTKTLYHIAPRPAGPSGPFRVRERTAQHFDHIQQAKAHVPMRFDPENGLKPYDRAKEPVYNNPLGNEEVRRSVL